MDDYEEYERDLEAQIEAAENYYQYLKDEGVLRDYEEEEVIKIGGVYNVSDNN